MFRKLFVITALVALPLIALTSACGGGNGMDMSSSATTVPAKPDQKLTLQAKNIKFVPDKLTVKSGTVVELTLENLDGNEHDFQVEGLDAEVMAGGSMNAEHGGSGGMMVSAHTMGNETASVTFRAMTKGTYNIVCTIAGHKEAGMVGTLTVE